MTRHILCLLDQEDNATIGWALPMLKSLSHYADVQVLCRAEQKSLLDNLPWLAAPMVVYHAGSWPRLLWRLRQQRWNSIWDLSLPPLTPWRQTLPFLIPSPHRLMLAGSSPFNAERLPFTDQQHIGERFHLALASLKLSPEHQWLPPLTEPQQHLLSRIGDRSIVAINLLDDDGDYFMPLVEQFKALLQGLPKTALVLLHPLPPMLEGIHSPRLFCVDEHDSLTGWQLLARAQSLLSIDSAWVQRAAVLGVSQLAVADEDALYHSRWHPNDLHAAIWRYQEGEPLAVSELLRQLRKLQKSQQEPNLSLI
ncbi:glycosyltransferase family 9 protein [Gallaecimonas mangrovi]|uniref:hypothetical protein n=1 Tax=Gallaecimonas mangrovi TaxID=2291597 RepID=UPI000E208DB7|nr:hypothetical protein [Gallaecimonas mangrovi]